ncbi:MAG: histidine kinase [Chloroflexi bacterium]|nr:histidine kinase [Chloroflexota bacterium]
MDGKQDAVVASSNDTDTGWVLLDGAPEEQQLAWEAALNAELERIAGYLHDKILQSFATCLLKVQLVERLAQMGRYDQMQNELTQLEDSLDDAIDKMRDLATSLRRPRRQ